MQAGASKKTSIPTDISSYFFFGFTAVCVKLYCLDSAHSSYRACKERSNEKAEGARRIAGIVFLSRTDKDKVEIWRSSPQFLDSSEKTDIK